jgi:hypothetical protein
MEPTEIPFKRLVRPNDALTLLLYKLFALDLFQLAHGFV